MKYDLSILIPALREEFLANTVENILKNKRGKTEVIVGLDGEWSTPPVADHPDVTIVYVSKNQGQRGITNTLAKLSRAKYVAKCDAHVAFDEGFDVKLMEALDGHDDWTIVPVMKNLHAFDWVCEHCNMRYYQGPVPDICRSDTCQFDEQKFRKEAVFQPRTKERTGWNSPNSSAYKFTPSQLQFKYFGSLKTKQQRSGERIVETMSLQGSFFMLTRAKYWELNICDESWGGWGQQGTEVALKTWLSGGRVVCNLDTWYAHLFRTQDSFSFPWNGNGISQGSQQRQARKACVDLFKNNAWDKQVRPLSWLVERFWDELQQEPDKRTGKDVDPRWTQDDLNQLKATEGRFNKSSENQDLQKGGIASGVSKGILYFTDNELPLKIARPVQKRIKQIAKDKGLELVSSSRKPMSMGGNVVTREPRGYLTMFKQILKGLEVMRSDVVFMAEHDVLYPPEHFDFTPTEHKFYYDVNWVKIHLDDLSVVRWRADQVSGLCAFREDLIKYYKWRIETFDKDNFDRKFEPFSGEGSEQWEASVPHIDIRHGKNLTYNKRGLHHFRKKETAVNFEITTIDKIPGWSTATLESVIK